MNRSVFSYVDVNIAIQAKYDNGKTYLCKIQLIGQGMDYCSLSAAFLSASAAFLFAASLAVRTLL